MNIDIPQYNVNLRFHRIDFVNPGLHKVLSRRTSKVFLLCNAGVDETSRNFGDSLDLRRGVLVLVIIKTSFSVLISLIHPFYY